MPFVVGTADIVGSQFKFVGLHDVMLCKGLNMFELYRGPCLLLFFFPKMGDRRQDMAKPPQKRTIILKEHMLIIPCHCFSCIVTEHVFARVQRCIIMHDQNLSIELDFFQ
jgi:hypothetical protein